MIRNEGFLKRDTRLLKNAFVVNSSLDTIAALLLGGEGGREVFIVVRTMIRPRNVGISHTIFINGTSLAF